MCRIVTEDGDEWRTVVNPPTQSAYAIDSDDAFDHVARAVLSFLDKEEVTKLPIAYAMDGNSIFVSRDEEKPWPE